MSKAVSIMKMPDSVKMSSTITQSVEPDSSGLMKFGTIATLFSTGWSLAIGSVAGYVLIPETGIPIVLNVVGAGLLFLQGLAYFGDEVPTRIPKHLRSLAKISSRLDGSAGSHTLKKEGFPIKSWTRAPLSGNIHFLLPFRMFSKLKMHESITYFPHEDKYVKRTHHLTFSRWVEREETYEGHRAVFQKAIDSF